MKTPDIADVLQALEELTSRVAKLEAAARKAAREKQS